MPPDENTQNAGTPGAAQVDTASIPAGPAAGAQTPEPGAQTPAGETLTPEQIAQAATDKAAADKEAADKAAAKPEGAPEKYEFKFEDGGALNPEVQTSFEAVARELNMSQADAQKIVTVMGPQIAAVQAQAVEQVKAEWLTAVQTDKEFGGKDLDANIAVAKKAMDAFGTPELKTFLTESGLGNHPEMVRMMFRAGKALSTDKFVAGSAGATPGKSAAKTLYPSSN